MLDTRGLLRLAIAWAWLAPACSIAGAEESPPHLAVPRPDPTDRPMLPQRSRTAPAPGTADHGAGWWLGPAGIAGALAVFGGVSLASRRFLPARDSASIRVIGRSALSAKHAACLLRVGDRVLIVGIGPQGPPSTLGEVTDPDELARLLSRPSPRPVPARAVASPLPSTRFDQRIGGDE